MIKLILGNIGSGKTAYAVREMYLNKLHRKTYSNIHTRLKNQVDISPEMIVAKDISGYRKNRKTGEQEAIYKYRMNKEYWMEIKEPINIVLDEIHSVMNARRAMSKINVILTDWLALIRRVLGGSESGYGELTLISQLWNRIDIIARDMSTMVIYCICHYTKTCRKCGFSWNENSEMPQDIFSEGSCPKCRDWRIRKHSHRIEVLHFPDVNSFRMWKEMGMRTFYRHYLVTDIENYFKYYNTLQWDNLFSMYY